MNNVNEGYRNRAENRNRTRKKPSLKTHRHNLKRREPRVEDKMQIIKIGVANSFDKINGTDYREYARLLMHVAHYN